MAKSGHVISKKPINDPTSPLSPPSPKKKVRQLGADSFDTDDEGFSSSAQWYGIT